jgi:hypothetical protein
MASGHYACNGNYARKPPKFIWQSAIRTELQPGHRQTNCFELYSKYEKQPDH